MKAQKKSQTLLIFVVFVVSFISWSFLRPHRKANEFNGSNKSQTFFPVSDKGNYDPVADTEDIELSKIPINDNYPVAENVFVQKIKGDDTHIMIIAQYSRTELNERYLAINNN